MKLKEYLEKEERSIRWLAKKIGCHYNTVYNGLYGYTMMRPAIAKKIEEYTKGAVKVKDLIDEPPCCPTCKRILRRKDYNVKKDIVVNPN